MGNSSCTRGSVKVLQQLRETIRKSETLRRFVTHRLASSGLFDHVLPNWGVSEEWQQRISLAMESSDNEHIPRVANAGQLIHGTQIMHNGLRINCGSYYGPELLQLLLQNRGVHEPQEERVFKMVVNSLQPGAVMLELGAYWAFYSMWFLSVVPRGKAYMVEPESFRLECGERNFKLNGLRGDFTHAFISDEPRPGGMMVVNYDSVERSDFDGGEIRKGELGPPTITVDEFSADKNIDRIDVLHSDIQGHELDMLRGAKRMLDEQRVGYIFLSSHSNELHDQCRKHLLERGFIILADANLPESFSFDGVLVARASHCDGIGPIAISKHSS